jgi:diguanylate cyclase (GGDEF)-like protein
MTSAQAVPSLAERWSAAIVAGLVVAAVAITLPFGSRPLPAIAAFLPVYLTLAATGDARPLALLAVAYSATAVVAVAQACAFPGLFSPDGLFGAHAQTAVWLWAVWHGGFPLLVMLYAIGRRTLRDGIAVQPRSVVFAVLGAGVALGVLAAAVTYVEPLPVLVQGTSYIGGFAGTWQTVIGLAVVGLVVTVTLTRLSTALDLWLAVVLVSTLGEVILTVFSHDRFSVGWYLSRVFSVVTSLTVALVFVVELARLYHRFAWLASVDALTGLANRRTFDERIEAEQRDALRTGDPCALLMIDVDDFKRYNDTYGHVAGDAALRTVAHAIESVVHRPRDVVARFGGEEFAVVLPLTAPDAAAILAERIRSEVVARRVPHRANRAGPFVTISIGVAGAAPGDADPTVMIERADVALYRAKEAGRNCVQRCEEKSIERTAS